METVLVHPISMQLENSAGYTTVRLVSAGSWDTQREDFNNKCELKQIETGEEQKDTIRYNKTEVFDELEPIADLRGGRRLRMISGFWTTCIIEYLLVLAGELKGNGSTLQQLAFHFRNLCFLLIQRETAGNWKEKETTDGVYWSKREIKWNFFFTS